MAFALVPLLVFAVRAIRNGIYPVFDNALNALRIHDVFSMHPPTVGAGTSFGLIALEAGANHPGPLPFILLAPIYALSGFRPSGLVVSVVVYNAAFIVLTARMARRIGGTALLVLAMAGILVLQRSFGGDIFTSPWNPYLALMPFTAFIFSTWATLVDRRSAALPWAVLTGSVAVQAQAAYAPGVAILLGIAGIAAIVRAVHDRGEPRSAALPAPRSRAGHRTRRLVASAGPAGHGRRREPRPADPLVPRRLPAHRLDRVAPGG